MSKLDYLGAICVLENYLDGALADYENGEVDNDFLIESCIDALELMYKGRFVLCVYEWRERFNKAKKEQGKEETEE